MSARSRASLAIFTLLLFLLISIAPPCSAESGSPKKGADPVLVITQPSANESVFAEMRDFYVYGIFPTRMDKPGDIRIELFRGDNASGERVRLAVSHVDPVTGTTPWSAIDMNYSEGLDWGNRMVPDLVREPGGLLDPSNKVVVTNDYYLGLILGGATKDFDTTYRDSEGKILQDLTAGNYTIRVTGLSGDLAGQVAEKTITFGLTSSALSTDRPPVNLDNRFQYAWNHHLRVYRDWFPGYFLFYGYGNTGYSVPRRWNPNNGIEVVNDREGTILDNPSVAENTMIQYNINEKSTTYAVEIAAIVRYGQEDNKNSTFLYYDIGEPFLAYYDLMSGRPVNVTGTLHRIQTDDRLVLTRAEIYPAGITMAENTFDPNNTTTPMQVDYCLEDGITVFTGSSFTLYGVTKPINTSVTATAVPYRFMLDDRIAGITYRITDSQGREVYRSDREVNLSRLFTPGSGQRYNSVFEFGHQFRDLNYPGTYRVSLSGGNVHGAPVPGTEETFTVTVQPPGRERGCTYRDIWSWYSARVPLTTAVPATQDSCAGRFPRFIGGNIPLCPPETGLISER
jgi:hypothetical protein